MHRMQDIAKSEIDLGLRRRELKHDIRRLGVRSLERAEQERSGNERRP
jgi:hypothetical protein